MKTNIFRHEQNRVTTAKKVIGTNFSLQRIENFDYAVNSGNTTKTIFLRRQDKEVQDWCHRTISSSTRLNRKFAFVWKKKLVKNYFPTIIFRHRIPAAATTLRL